MPEQAKPLGTILETKSSSTPLRRGDVAYFRVGVDGFINENGRDVAVLTAIDRRSNRLDDATWYVPAAWLIPGETCIQEIKENKDGR